MSTFSVSETGDVVIETPEKAYYDELAATRKDGAWEFNTPGDTEGWTSSEMKLAVDEGYMACESLDQNKDPKIRFKKTLSLVANKYASMEIRVRYKYTSKGPHTNAGITIESAAFDYGFTDATAVFADNAITVTGKGYAGVISVLLTDSDGNTYPYEIRLFGGKYSKPGLNIYTGTTEALDIGDLGGLISGNKLALTAMGKLGVAEKDGKLGVNALDGKILLNADFDRSRAIGISFDYMGKFSWLSVFNSHGWQEFWSFHSWKPVTYDTWRSVSNVAKGGTCKTCGNDPAKSEDGDHASFDVHGGEYGGSYIVFLNNLNFTPYYKITYVNGETTTDVYALYDENGVLLTSYTPDASVLGAEFYTLAAESDTYYPVTAPITLDHKDITLYAYTPDENAPINAMQTSIRPASATASAGIRFLSTVRAKTQLTADEYGYIVAREDKLLADGGTVDALKFGADTTYKNDGKNFTGTTANGVKYTGAVNYSKANGIRILYDTDADTGDIRFTGVTIGLDGAYTKNGITYANRYAERFTARPYVKIGDVTYYGACYTTSLAEKAQALIDSGDTNEEYRTIVEQAGKEA